MLSAILWTCIGFMDEPTKKYGSVNQKPLEVKLRPHELIFTSKASARFEDYYGLFVCLMYHCVSRPPICWFRFMDNLSHSDSFGEHCDQAAKRGGARNERRV